MSAEPDIVPEMAAEAFVEIPANAGLRTAPLGFVVKAIEGVKNAIFPMVAAFFAAGSSGYAMLIAIGAGAVIIGLTGFFAWLRWTRLRYYVGNEDIRLESGILSREARSVPFERIQDVSLEQKLIPRLLGLTQIKFETGAGGKDELSLEYVTGAEGERLREVVRERREGAVERAADGLEPDTIGEEDAPPVESAAPIFEMNDRRVITFGAFEFSLVIFAVLAGAAQQFDFLLPFDIWDWEQWAGVAGEQTDIVTGLNGLGIVGQVFGVILALGSVAVIGVLTGIARTFAREYEFRLDRTPKGFRRQRGLFTKTDVVMPVHRVQAARIQTGLIRRRFGWHSLKFISLAQDNGSSSHAVAPFAKMAEIWPIAAEADITPASDELEWLRPSPKKWVDGAIVLSVILLMVAIGWSIAGFLKVALAIIAIGFPLIALGFWLGWKRHRFARDVRQLFVREGLLSPDLTIAPRVRLQSVEIRHGPLSRWRGYCELHFGLAGGSLSIDGIAFDDAEKLRSEVLESIVSVDFSDLPK
ncbi:PH domain-containing protein [Altererythrobacter sp. ZODW24]|uniref:PH domain-containing protein n=1 Tax=Altererythrobacter sp. ZODW24 TaxID=2185142 RepID=UPI000DF84CF5|nr:PH domain-containing protein [Altererythrobacter sp. ZODW24]